VSDLRAITDAEAVAFPRPCRVCGELLNRGTVTGHALDHAAESLRELRRGIPTAVHALHGLADAPERYRDAMLRA
jgi:hypothetical protein